MFDTHCHLNSYYFEGHIDEVIKNAQIAGVKKFVIPGTDLKTSKKAVEIAENHENVWAAVGIHPHHVFQYQTEDKSIDLEKELKELEELLNNKKVIAVGEVGMDRHYYAKTKYSNYEVSENFIDLQRQILMVQVGLANRYKKAIILHNREAMSDFLQVLEQIWEPKMEKKTVFHCCEPDEKLLEFSKKHNIFIGIDGDITYFKEKREFVKKIPSELLVLETDSPFLTPEPLRTNRVFPNEPKNLKLIAEYIAKKLEISVEKLTEVTTKNAERLFLSE